MSDLESRINQHAEKIAAGQTDIKHMSLAIANLSKKIDENHIELRQSIHDFRDIVAHKEVVDDLSKRMGAAERAIDSIKQTRNFFTENWFKLIQTVILIGGIMITLLISKYTKDAELLEYQQNEALHIKLFTQQAHDLQEIKGVLIGNLKG